MFATAMRPHLLTERKKEKKENIKDRSEEYYIHKVGAMMSQT